MIHNVEIMVGSNTPDRHRKINEAVCYVKSILCFPRTSELYETPDFSGLGADYLNVIVSGKWTGRLDRLNKQLRDKETELGRDRSDKINVAADIDIVVADGKVLKEKEYNSAAFRLGIEYIKLNKPL